MSFPFKAVYVSNKTRSIKQTIRAYFNMLTAGANAPQSGELPLRWIIFAHCWTQTQKLAWKKCLFSTPAPSQQLFCRSFYTTRRRLDVYLWTISLVIYQQRKIIFQVAPQSNFIKIGPGHNCLSFLYFMLVTCVIKCAFLIWSCYHLELVWRH